MSTVSAALGIAVQGATLLADNRLPLMVSVSESTALAEERRKKKIRKNHTQWYYTLSLVAAIPWSISVCVLAMEDKGRGWALPPKIWHLASFFCQGSESFIWEFAWDRDAFAICAFPLSFSCVSVQPHICFRAYKDLFGRYSNTDLAESVISAG